MFAHEGTIVHFTGDGMMVLFNDPLPCAVHAARVLLAHLGVGECFGERALLTGEPRNAAVVADVESVLVSVSRETVEQLLGPDSPTGPFSRTMALREQPSAHRFHNEATSLLVVSIADGTFLVGRGEDCDFPIRACGIADHHVSLTVEHGVCTVVDLSPSERMYLNREPVERGELREGDALRIGSAHLFLLDGVLKVFISQRGVMVQAERLRRAVKRGGRVLLSDVSLTIYPGELVAIVGPSGAGKTTLLRALVGLDRPESGTILYDGTDLETNLDHFRQQLGYVPQNDTLHLELSVERSLRYAGRLRLPRETPPAELEQRISRLLDALHLANRGGTLVGRLSGGQRKRTCVAAELLSNPGILFLDEPTSGLDPGLDLQLMTQFRELADDGRTVVLTTHATRNIRICDRVIVLSDGELVFDGAPAEALAHFGIDDFVEVYPALAMTPAAELADRYKRSRFAARRESAAQPAFTAPSLGRVPASSPPSPLFQLFQLLARDTRVILADRVTTALRLFGGPLLAALLLATFDRRIFALERADAGNAQQAITLLYLSAAICLFLGAFTSANVITRERGIYQRERVVNLSAVAYVTSKVVVLSVFSTLQGFVFIAVLEAKVDFPGGTGTALQLACALAIVSLCGMGMGLLISALSGNPDRAAILVVLALIPQLVFAGSTVPRSEMTPVSKVVSDFTVTKWALELTGSLTGLDRRIAAQSLLTVDTAVGPAVVQIPVRPFENAFKGAEATRWVALAGFLVVFYAATLIVQSRKR